jgi:hypothetical protein
MRVLGLMVLLALTGCQSSPPLDAAQAQCGHAPCYCSYKNQLVTASSTQRYGGQLPPEACYQAPLGSASMGLSRSIGTGSP